MMLSEVRSRSKKSSGKSNRLAKAGLIKEYQTKFIKEYRFYFMAEIGPVKMDVASAFFYTVPVLATKLFKANLQLPPTIV